MPIDNQPIKTTEKRQSSKEGWTGRAIHTADGLRRGAQHAAESTMSWVYKKAYRKPRAQLGDIPSIAFNPDARAFLSWLRDEINAHEAVNHPLLARVAHVPFTKEDYRIFGLQHYPLVGNFTTYMEYLLLRAPASEAKIWLAKVLVDEYGERSSNLDHAYLYRDYLRTTGSPEGEEYETQLHVNVTGFIGEHLRICREEPFLVGLGAIGPGHEWAIPKMFDQIIRGLLRAGFTEKEIIYFTTHTWQDEDHGAWLEEALVDYATTQEAQNQIYRGTMLSLAARARLWSGVQDKIVRWRQPRNVHLRTDARSNRYAAEREITFREWEVIAARGGDFATGRG